MSKLIKSFFIFATLLITQQAYAACAFNAACSKAGQTCEASRQTGANGTVVVTTYTCTDCLRWGRGTMTGTGSGQICGKNTTVFSASTSVTHTKKMPNGECYEYEVKDTTTVSEQPKTTVDCNNSYGGKSTDLACTPLTSTEVQLDRTGYAYSNGWKIPPGGQNGYRQTRSESQYVEDQSCPSPSRTVKSTCSLTGDPLGLPACSSNQI